MIYHRKYKKNLEVEKKVEIPSSLHIGFSYKSVEVTSNLQKEEEGQKEEVVNMDKNGVEYTTKKHNHKKGKK